MKIFFQDGERNEKEFKKEFGEDKVSFLRVDISSHTSFENAFEKCLDLFGGIDVVVNNAGVNAEIDWETQLQINFSVRQCLHFQYYLC